MSVTRGLSAANKRTAIDVKIVCERMSRFDGQWYWTNTLQQVSDGLTKVQARQRLVENLRRGYHALKFDPTFTAGKKLTTEQRQQRENELHQATEFGANILCCDEVLLTSEASGSVSLRGMSMCDAGYSGRTVKIVKELREKFDLARSDHNSPFAHPVRCMDPLRSTLRECEVENPKHAEWESTLSHSADGCERPKCTRWPSSASPEDTFSRRLTADSDARRDFAPGWVTCDELWESTRV